MKNDVVIKCPYDNSEFGLKEVLSVRNYKNYIWRKELIDDTKQGGDGIVMKNCYSLYNGEWIGTTKYANFLCNKKGLTQIQKKNSEFVCMFYRVSNC